MSKENIVEKNQDDKVYVQVEVGCYKLPKCCGADTYCSATFHVFNGKQTFYNCGCSA